VRLKDKHAALLRAQARELNFVWNYVNDLSSQVLQREGRFIASDELHAFTKGATKQGLSLHSQSVQAVNEEFVIRRKQFKKAKLRWRVSNPDRANYSLGWIPFKKSALRYVNGQVHFAGTALSLWDSYGLADYELGSGSICEDARGRWYLNICVKVKQKARPPASELGDALGIDLGLKALMTDSEGNTVEAQRFYRDLEPKIASAQRAGKKDRARALHAKVANRRKDGLHKLATVQARSRSAIFVGQVNASRLTRTRRAKSVLDAGWSTYRNMLKYKCADAGAWFNEVDEAFSTQDCHLCKTRCGPKGLAGLSVRQWTCTGCHAVHDRDVNASCNILARGLAWLEQQFSEADSRLKATAAANKDSGA